YVPYDFTWTPARRLFGYSYLDDRLPQIEWQRPYLCAVWTQGLDPHYTVPFERKEFSTPPPYQAIDLGQEAPSPITVERDGYIEYGPEAYKTVDFDSNKLIYHITGLEGSDKWTVKFILYHEGADKWKERIRIDDGWTRNEWVYPYQVTQIEGIIPEAFLMDGEITVTVEVTQGELAVLSAIVLEREPKGQGGGPQSLTVAEIPSVITLNCFPNPSRNRTLITYTLPSPCEVKLSVYNSLGQLIQTIEHSKQSAGFYTINWNNDDSNNRGVASGIYFIRLETPEKSIVKKLIVLE
ncbi:MAG: T9SS type A sorting domain-containing protein, partial [candidate division WOR-3 bacterium]